MDEQHHQTQEVKSVNTHTARLMVNLIPALERNKLVYAIQYSYLLNCGSVGSKAKRGEVNRAENRGSS